MIEEARASVAVAVNAGLTMLYWRIGRRINQEVLKEGRAEYGKGILATLSQELSQNYGIGCGKAFLQVIFGSDPLTPVPESLDISLFYIKLKNVLTFIDDRSTFLSNIDNKQRQ